MGWVVKSTPLSKRTGHYYEDKEIALHKEVGRNDKDKRYKNNWYPEAARLEAATLWAVVRDIPKVHKITQIPPYIIKGWMQEPWWDEIVKRVRKEQNELLDAKLSEVITKAVDVINERLEHGEVMIDRKTKKEFRVPVNVKSASIALETTFKERQLIRGEATSRSESTSAEDKFEKLKRQFESLASIKKPKKLIEGTFYEPVSGTGEGQTGETNSEDLREVSSEGQGRESPRGEEVNALDQETE